MGEFGELLLITSSPSKAHIDASFFHIPRDDEEPPRELLELVWPELDRCIEARDAEQMDPVRPSAEYQVCLAAAAFMNLLRQLRGYLLHDSAILRPISPNHPAWSHEVFRHPLYTPLLSGFNSDMQPTREQQLAAVVPAVAAEPQLLRQEQTQASMQRSIDQSGEETRLLREQNELLRELLSGQQRAITAFPIRGRGDEGGSLRGELAGAGMSTLPAMVGGGDRFR
jgi:Centromere DNA-binding protein complex CBF3 subunit, domain 2